MRATAATQSIALISPPTGSISTGGSHTFDGVFDVGLVLATTPIAGAVTISPWTNVPAGVPMTFTASAVGASPLSYQWQFNNGGGFVNLQQRQQSTRQTCGDRSWVRSVLITRAEVPGIDRKPGRREGAIADALANTCGWGRQSVWAFASP